jgi:hypothetical protein
MFSANMGKGVKVDGTASVGHFVTYFDRANQTGEVFAVTAKVLPTTYMRCARPKLVQHTAATYVNPVGRSSEMLCIAHCYGSVRCWSPQTSCNTARLETEMFVETRTEVAEVLAEMFRAVDQSANGVIGDVRTRRQHPSYISKTMVREGLSQLVGAYALAAKVAGGVDQLPEELHAKVRAAHDAVAAL